MKSRFLRLCVVLGGFLFLSIIPARAANNVLNPLHCDFNKDGKADILWRNSATGEVDVWYMNGLSYTSAQILPTVPPYPSSLWHVLACGDLLNDGNTDIIWGYESMGTYYLMLWLESGINLTQSCTLTAINGPGSFWLLETAQAADIDGNGPLDILWHGGSGQDAIWYMNGCSFLSDARFPSTADGNWVVRATGDFNGDGNADLLWQNLYTGQAAIWLMNNTTILESAAYGPYGYGPIPPDGVFVGWWVVAVADFDGDGKSDILWQNISTGEVAIWFMDGLTVKSAVSLANVGPGGGTDGVLPGWCVMGVDDYDGDGHPDIFWWNLGTGEVALWLMNGSTILQSGVIATVGFESSPGIKGLNCGNGL